MSKPKKAPEFVLGYQAKVLLNSGKALKLQICDGPNAGYQTYMPLSQLRPGNYKAGDIVDQYTAWVITQPGKESFAISENAQPVNPMDSMPAFDYEAEYEEAIAVMEPQKPAPKVVAKAIPSMDPEDANYTHQPANIIEPAMKFPETMNIELHISMDADTRAVFGGFSAIMDAALTEMKNIVLEMKRVALLTQRSVIEQANQLIMAVPAEKFPAINQLQHDAEMPSVKKGVN